MSIPFFSLGRRVHSVSRTWSRHPSMDPTPEWANQTRRVTRPEDIVINRDDELERGELATEKPDGLLPGRTTDSSPIEKTSQSSAPMDPAREKEGDEDQPRPDNAPDTATGNPNEKETTSWQEGRHLVVEHHLPGEEVRQHRTDTFSFCNAKNLFRCK